MTLLVGSNSTGAFTANDQYSNALIWYQQYTASVSGTAHTLYFYGYDNTDNSDIKLAIWDGSGNLLASTSAFVASGGGGAGTWYSGSISGVSIVMGNKYCLGFCTSGYVGGMSNGTSVSQPNVTNSYPTVNNVAPATDSTNQTILMYADGTTGGAPLSQYFLGAKLLTPHPASLALALPAWIIKRRRRLARRS